ncbi:MAG: hypothetical protein JRL30_27705, partial [Deltaproteobacteria bacterium]|nr:hypothetical protein [Deltaproteobacteria bacterium]
MNWVQIIVNAGVTAACIGLVGWLVRRWVINVDANLRKMVDKMQTFEIKLAEMPGKYVMKNDCSTSEKNNSDKRANLWQELNKFKGNIAE